MVDNSGGGEFTDTLSVEIERKTCFVVDGEPVEAFNRRLYDNGQPSTFGLSEFWANRNDGLYEIGRVNSIDTLVVGARVYPYPAPIGDEGFYVGVIQRDTEPRLWRVTDTLSVEVLATDEPIVTPAGSFSCTVYRTYHPPPEDVLYGSYVDEYFAVGVGKVAWMVRSESDPQQIRMRRLLYQYILE